MRRARRYARKNQLYFSFDPAKGKGSHGTVFMGNHSATVQHGEIAPNTLASMFRRLGINRQEF